MIRIQNEVVKKQHNFWNHALFHPTDAVEDPWGRRLLDRFAEDGAVKTVRVYTMFEDIVYLDEDGNLQFDFRLNDLRLDYLLEKGYDLLLAYAGMPDCIASSCANKTTAAKNKTRYKGKMWNSAPPKDYKFWEEICYEYTKHIVERYGLERVCTWRIHCFNEPDIAGFFLSELPKDANMERLKAYLPLYEAFQRGIRRVSEKIKIGGPALANRLVFLEGFLNHVREHDWKLDYIALHNYGTSPKFLNDGSKPLTVENNIARHEAYMEVIRRCGFGDTEIIIDEWGGATQGFYNREEAPDLMFRETEVFSAYYAKLIQRLIFSEYKISKMLICLSGQHEMVEDFTGFRNFFTLNFIAKPIYNAYRLAAMLGESILSSECDDPHVSVIPTQNEKGEAAVMITYCDKFMTEDLPEIEETLSFADDLSEKTVTVYCIDREHTNPYRLFEKMGSPEKPSKEQLRSLREEGTLKPISVQSGREPIRLKLTANSTYLITVK